MCYYQKKKKLCIKDRGIFGIQLIRECRLLNVIYFSMK